MTERTLRAGWLGLLASTALASPAFAQNAPPPAAAPAPAQTANESDEIIITATKREENLQNVPINVQVLGTRRLDQLNISNFEQYTRQLPSVSFQSAQPGVTVVYMRGVATGGDGNHSGSLPSVGTYLDEQPVTTIGGTLDVHIYDIARIESLAGPQGTLYGASSEAGTIRIITNKPDLSATYGRVDGELNTVTHGGIGGKLEGMLNIPISRNIAFRGVAFYQHDAGYIDNIHGERTYYIFGPTAFPAPINVPPLTVTNTGREKKNFNDLTTYGGRAALKIDLDDNWTATPTFMYQKMKANGDFFFDPNLGKYKIDRFRGDVRTDKFWQAALTIQGKIANFDVTYAGAYMVRPTHSVTDYADYADQYEQLYAYYGGNLYFPYVSSVTSDVAPYGPYINPQQYVIGTDHFRKMSQELRFASPQENRFRVIAGLFYQRQSNDIHQDYKMDGLAPEVSVNGLPGTLWLTQQKRVDRDYAAFGEASFDVTPKITLTAGGRLYKFDNTLIGFFGFGRNPGIDPLDGRPFTASPFNAGLSSRTGVAGCYLTNGMTLREAYLAGVPIAPFVEAAVSGSPCTNLGVFEDGKVKPKRIKDHGFIHRLNATWKPQQNLMFYATWSRGFRPGGINRRGEIPPYDPDFLTNYELGWKTTFGPIRWNGAIYHQLWKAFQFSFLGENSFTEIHNGSNARINGIETDVNYVKGGLTLNAAAAYTDAKTKGNTCFYAGDTASDCSSIVNVGNALRQDFISAPSGTRLPVTPKFKASGSARYQWPAWADVKAHVQGAVTYQGSAAATLRTTIDLSGTNPNDFLGKVRSSTVVDLFAGLDWPRWNLEIFAANVFDSRNELSRGVNCGGCIRTVIVPGRPRTIGVRAGVKF